MKHLLSVLALFSLAVAFAQPAKLITKSESLAKEVEPKVIESKAWSEIHDRPGGLGV